MSHLGWVPTLLAAAGEPDDKEKLLKGHQINGATYKAHLDGDYFLPYMTGETAEVPRKEFFYFSDDAQLVALRREQWKLVFAEQCARVDVLLTWNCRHLANPSKMEHVRVVNYGLGLPMPLLTTPLNYLSGDEPDAER